MRDEKGIALLFVLWVMTALAVVVAASASSMREELFALRNFKEEAEAYYLAFAGIQQAMAEVLNADRDEGSNSTRYDSWEETWRTNPPAYENVPLGRGSYRVVVVDEESKLSINRASPDALRRLLEATGMEGALLDTVVDSILDWRDPDRDHRLSGAEDDYYLSLPRPYRAKNGEFDSLEELLLVKGVTPEVLYGSRDSSRGERRYRGIAQHLTVENTTGVNINTASPEVLFAIGLNRSEVARIMERRSVGGVFRHPSEIRAILTNEGDLNRFLPLVLVKSVVFRVESEGVLKDGSSRRRIVAVFRKEGALRSGSLTIVRWEDNALFSSL